MKISLNWLSQYIDLSGLSVDEMSDMLTFAGIEVEDIHQQGVDSSYVVVARVASAEKHPQADRLKVCQVDVGDGSLHQIVCGAQNYKVGDKVPCALPGAVLPGNFEIKVGKLRGVESRGMLCSASELGLPDKEHGLWILPQDLQIGTPISQVVKADTLVEVEITPNRPDLLSHNGMAFELAAISGREYRPVVINDADLELEPAGEFVRLEQPELNPYYTAVKINGVKVQESPEWLKERLVAVGLRPINNIVDITNYVLHELGTPLHAFDAAKVQGGIITRTAKEGEVFKALDGQEYTLNCTDLVIADQAGKVLAIGGVMGGEESGVTESTTDIILESAWFKPSSVRATSRRLSLSSDSSYRFERGTSAWNVLRGSVRAVELILQLAGGLASKTYVAGAPVPNPAAYNSNTSNVVGTVAVSLKQGKGTTVSNALGYVKLPWEALDQISDGSIAHEEGARILTALGLKQAPNDAECWLIPPHRLDLTRPCDLLEEIVRVFGLEGIPSRFSGPFVEESPVDAAYNFQMGLRRKLAALGFYETQTIKLIASESADATIAQVKDAMPLRPLQEGDIIRVSLPLSEDHSVLRPAHTPGLIAAAVRNSNQGVSSLRFFELGRVFRNTGGGKGKDIETDTMGILISGDRTACSWANPKPEHASFEDLLAVMEVLAPGHRFTLTPARPREQAALGADVQLDGKACGYFARLSLARCRELGLAQPVYVAELDLRKLQEILTAPVKAAELPQFPGSSRDAAIELPIATPNADIVKAIEGAKEKLLVSYSCFDVFTDPSGEKLPKDRKSIAYSFLYRDPSKTLTAAEVDAAHQRVLKALTDKVKGLSFR